MTKTGLKRKIKRLGFEHQEIPVDKYHREVDLKFADIRGRFVDFDLPDTLYPQGSEDSVWLSCGFVVIGIDDYLGQIKSFKKGTNEIQA